MLCYLDFFGANLSAFVVAFAAPRAMRLIHNLQALQRVFDAAIKNVPVRSDNRRWTYIRRVFFLVDWAGGDAASAHYAFYVIIKLETLLNGLQVLFALFRSVRLMPLGGCTDFSLSKNGSKSTTKSFTTWKTLSGSIRISLSAS